MISAAYPRHGFSFPSCAQNGYRFPTRQGDEHCGCGCGRGFSSTDYMQIHPRPCNLFAAQRCTSILVFVARPTLIEMLLKLPGTRLPCGSTQSLQEPVLEGFRLFLNIVESYQGWRLDIQLEEWQD